MNAGAWAFGPTVLSEVLPVSWGEEEVGHGSYGHTDRLRAPGPSPHKNHQEVSSQKWSVALRLRTRKRC